MMMMMMMMMMMTMLMMMIPFHTHVWKSCTLMKKSPSSASVHLKYSLSSRVHSRERSLQSPFHSNSPLQVMVITVMMMMMWWWWWW
jgi:hypothetical protein